MLAALPILLLGVPLLSPVFTDHMVLQRGKENPVWGWSTPGSQVTVSVAGQSASGIADSTGKWVVRLPAMAAGGPYTMSVDGSSHASLSDILVGDVWVCAGQSNMEMGLLLTETGTADAAVANDPNLRLCNIPRKFSYSPLAMDPPSWQPCTTTSVSKAGTWGGFSAVGYYFGRALRQATKIPIGLVQIAWGSTTAEAWTGHDALASQGDFASDLSYLDSQVAINAPQYPTYLERWMAEHDPGSVVGASWNLPGFDDSTWANVTVPSGYASLGVDSEPAECWFRKKFTLPNPLPNGGVYLNLGTINKTDWTWVNGTLVYISDSPSIVRNYYISPEVHPGVNSVAIRTLSLTKDGGFTSPSSSLYVQLGDGSKISLAGTWKGIAPIKVNEATPWPKDWGLGPSVPTVLYNGMVAPTAPLAVKGVIWYQGESNVDRAYQYRSLLPALMSSWRTAFGDPNLPFYIVGLSAYKAHQATPKDDPWAELREAQEVVAANDANSGLVTTTDIGDATDIHPKEKRQVGQRLAAIALQKLYSQAKSTTGPTFKSMTISGRWANVQFTNTGGSLVSRTRSVDGFAIAGGDQVWYWGTAIVNGNTVQIMNPAVSHPVAVRYGWQANPPTPLFGRNGLPAVPFRTDTWKLSTYGNK